MSTKPRKQPDVPPCICPVSSSSNLSNTVRDVDVEVDGEEGVDEEDGEVEQSEEGSLVSSGNLLFGH